MEKQDLELIDELVKNDEELAGLWKEHLDYEARLDEFNQRLYLTAEEELEKKRLQKMKLAGRDRIEAILAAHRGPAGSGPNGDG